MGGFTLAHPLLEISQPFDLELAANEGFQGL